jgi:hypothetical protein
VVLQPTMASTTNKANNTGALAAFIIFICYLHT